MGEGVITVSYGPELTFFININEEYLTVPVNIFFNSHIFYGRKTIVLLRNGVSGPI